MRVTVSSHSLMRCRHPASEPRSDRYRSRYDPLARRPSEVRVDEPATSSRALEQIRASVLAVMPDEARDLVRRARPAEEIALDLGALFGLQEAQLLRGL